MMSVEMSAGAKNELFQGTNPSYWLRSPSPAPHDIINIRPVLSSPGFSDSRFHTDTPVLNGYSCPERLKKPDALLCGSGLALGIVR